LKKVLLQIILIGGFGLIFIQAGIPSYRAVSSMMSYNSRIRKLKYSQVISEIATPDQAKRYLTEYLSPKSDEANYEKEDYIASFKRIHEKGSDDCDGGALAAAALLHDDGYPPLMLCMFKKEDSIEHHGGHAVFIYQVNGKWGTLGINEMDCHPPQYSSLEDIVRSYSLEKFKVVNIAQQYSDWIDNDIDMTEKIYRPDLAKRITRKSYQ
jgi:hypothetical protein